jgi:hypothetical protein
MNDVILPPATRGCTRDRASAPPPASFSPNAGAKSAIAAFLHERTAFGYRQGHIDSLSCLSP